MSPQSTWQNWDAKWHETLTCETLNSMKTFWEAAFFYLGKRTLEVINFATAFLWKAVRSFMNKYRARTTGCSWSSSEFHNVNQIKRGTKSKMRHTSSDSYIPYIWASNNIDMTERRIVNPVLPEMLFGPQNKQSIRRFHRWIVESSIVYIQIGTLGLRHSLGPIGPTSDEPWLFLKRSV